MTEILECWTIKVYAVFMRQKLPEEEYHHEGHKEHEVLFFVLFGVNKIERI